MATDANAASNDPPPVEQAEGRVAALYIAVCAGDPVQSQDAVQLVAGVGIVGDRYAARTGHWSDARWPDQQLTLVQEEVATELGLAPALLRRNVVTRGVGLADLIGVRFTIGGVELQGVRVCDPCMYLEQLVGRAGLARDLDHARGGLRADVLSDGRVAVGDRVVLSGDVAATTG